MKSKMNFCKKITYSKSNLDTSPTIIFGLILSEDKDFFIIRTARGKHHVSKCHIVSIEETTKEFQENWGVNGDKES